MATLYIAEYAAEPMGANGQTLAMAQEPPVAEQTLTIAGVSAASSAFNAKTKYIRVHTDAICSIVVDTNPTATGAKKRLAANTTEYFGVPQGQSYKIAVITNT